jgi:hypothetical protein
MRTSQFFFTTLKEAPSDAEVISQKMMLRAGYIKRAAAGIYTWMPLGLARAAQGRKYRPRRNEQCRRTGTADAGRSAQQNCGRNPAAGSNTARNCCASRTVTSANSSLGRRTRK